MPVEETDPVVSKLEGVKIMCVKVGLRVPEAVDGAAEKLIVGAEPVGESSEECVKEPVNEVAREAE